MLIYCIAWTCVNTQSGAAVAGDMSFRRNLKYWFECKRERLSSNKR